MKNFLYLIKIYFKKKSSRTKAEKIFFAKTAFFNVFTLVYALFVSSSIVFSLQRGIWWAACLHGAFLIAVTLAWLYFNFRWIQRERKYIDRTTEIADKIFNVKTPANFEQLTFDAKLLFLEYYLKDADNPIVDCMQELITHYNNTRNVSRTEPISNT